MFLFDDAVKEAFLEKVRRTGLVAKAARSVGTSSQRIKTECERDEEFSAEFQEALVIYSEVVQEEVARRAIEGVEEVVYFQGEACGKKTNYSDSLLTTLVKAKSPEFREKLSVDTTIHGGVLLTLPPAQTQEAWLEATQQAQLPAPSQDIQDTQENDKEIIDIPCDDTTSTEG